MDGFLRFARIANSEQIAILFQIFDSREIPLFDVFRGILIRCYGFLTKIYNNLFLGINIDAQSWVAWLEGNPLRGLWLLVDGPRVDSKRALPFSR